MINDLLNITRNIHFRKTRRGSVYSWITNVMEIYLQQNAIHENNQLNIIALDSSLWEGYHYSEIYTA